MSTLDALRAILSYDSAKNNAINALRKMTEAMSHMVAEHVNFHNHFGDVQKQLQDMKKAYGSKELDPEVIRSTALDNYLSEGNLPKVTALGHFAVDNALKNFQLQKKKLDEIRKLTGELVESLLGISAARVEMGVVQELRLLATLKRISLTCSCCWV